MSNDFDGLKTNSYFVDRNKPQIKVAHGHLGIERNKKTLVKLNESMGCCHCKEQKIFEHFNVVLARKRVLERTVYCHTF